MTKFNGRTVTPVKSGGFMKSTGQQIQTHEGGTGYKQDAKSEFFRLSVLNMGSDTFYEKGSDRDNRMITLLQEIVADDPGFVASFVPFLRGVENEDGEVVGMNMRRSSIVTGVEYGRALKKDIPPYRPRMVLASALQRADEPGEALAYYMTKYGKNLPMWLKRGVADATQRLYTQYSALKYNGASHGVSMGDVIELTHPIPRDVEQASLFRYLAYKHEEVDLSALPMIRRRRELDRVAPENRRSLLGTDSLKDVGATWEWISGWIPSMDAQVWEQVIPTMGYMALLRNLRNFEEKGVSDAVLENVAARLSDPTQVQKSRQFPYRFLSAYRELSGTRFIHPLEQALELSVRNVPYLKGKTLILQDTSASMGGHVSGKSKMSLQDLGAIFGAVLTQRAQDVDWVLYADGFEHFKARRSSILRTLDDVRSHNGRVGHGTQTFQTLAQTYNGHDRVVIITDMQAFPYPNTNTWSSYNRYGNENAAYNELLDRIKVPIYTFDVAGYESTHVEDKPNRYTLAGLNDTCFRQIELLESGREGQWPWM